MVKNEPRASILFVAGYADLSEEEFAAHYRPRLDEYLAETRKKPVIFALQDEPGAATMAARYLRDQDAAPAPDVHVYRCQRDSSSRSGGRTKAGDMDDAFAGTTVVDTAGGPAARDEAILAMIREKKAATLIWLREGDEFHRLSAGDVLDSRFRGPRELVRRLKTPGIEQAMAMFDELA